MRVQTRHEVYDVKISTDCAQETNEMHRRPLGLVFC